MSVDFSRFQAAFFEESEEHLQTMEEGLLQLEQRPDDHDLLNRIFRAAHSIKGNSGMFGFTTISDFTHKIENVLDGLRQGRVAVTKPIIDLLLEGTDGLRRLVEAVRIHTPADEAIVGALAERLQACAAAMPQGADAGSGSEKPTTRPTFDGLRRFTIRWTPGPTIFQRAIEPLRIMEELGRLGDLNAYIRFDRLPPLEELDPECSYLSWNCTLVTDHSRAAVEEVFEFVRDDGELTIHDHESAQNTTVGAAIGRGARLGEILLEDGVITKEALAHALAQQKRLGEILIEQKAVSPDQVERALAKQRQRADASHGKTAETATIRVDTEKIDKLINLVGELVITQSMLSDLGLRFEPRHLPLLLERLAQLERNTREIQERVMAIRMLPIGATFNRFPRLVRDLAARNGKQVHLSISGEETELDKTVIESISDPLTHLVRNAVDHGLESPEERAAAGKPATGSIRLNAFHEGGNICITVEDDGRGLNREKILEKAATIGLVGPAEQLSDEQVWNLIFQPGFSTADQITDVSGRGVGMDVVKRNIEALGGKVTIQTTPGSGTKFVLTLPLTLAIIDGMIVRVGPESYIIPLVSIVESIQPLPTSVKTIVGKGEVVNVRNTYYPILRLYEVFSIVPECTAPTKAILVILESEGERVAVMVDELLGQRQVVIKSLEQNFRKVDGIAGATIMGDGSVGFILDVRGLIEHTRRGQLIEA